MCDWNFVKVSVKYTKKTKEEQNLNLLYVSNIPIPNKVLVDESTMGVL